MGHEEVREAVSQEKEEMLTSIKGVGKKTARRLILELKDKLSDLEFERVGSSQSNAGMALQALTSNSLGFNGKEAREAISKVKSKMDDGHKLSVEDLIQEALRNCPPKW